MLISNGAERVEKVVERREQRALESKLRGLVGKLGFPNVCGSVPPNARHGIAVASLDSRRVAFLDPLPDALAEIVVAFGAVRVVLPNVKNEFVVSHLNARTHGFPFHGYVKSDVQRPFEAPQKTCSQVVGGVSLKVQDRLARDAQATRELKPGQPELPSSRLNEFADVVHATSMEL